jgi:hypothetical protein
MFDVVVWPVAMTQHEAQREGPMPGTARARGAGFEVVASSGDLTPPSLWARAKADLRRTFFKHPVGIMEVTAAAETLLAGIILILPFDTFASAPAFRTLAHIAPEWAWAIATLVPGVLAVWAWARGRYWTQLLALFGNMLWFTFAGSLLTIGNAIGFASLFVLQGFVLIIVFCRLSREWEVRAADTVLGHATARALVWADRAIGAIARRRYRVLLAARRIVKH